TLFRLERHHLLDDLLCGLPANLASAPRTMRNSYGRIEQAQIVINLGDCPYCGARIPRRSLLLDGNGRAKSINGVDLGPFHLIEELARIRRQRFDVPPLAFSVDRV